MIIFLKNYRRISLLPPISKIFEYVIFDQLLKYFTSNLLFCSEQFGLRPSHTTELASSRFMNHIVQQMDQHHTPISIVWTCRKHLIL